MVVKEIWMHLLASKAAVGNNLNVVSPFV
jgi:hypothetical protein